jgi:hypothetical protein
MLMTFQDLFYTHTDLESMMLSELADVLDSFQLERSCGQGKAKSFWSRHGVKC